jgi:hypothetical protein
MDRIVCTLSRRWEDGKIGMRFDTNEFDPSNCAEKKKKMMILSSFGSWRLSFWNYYYEYGYEYVDPNRSSRGCVEWIVRIIMVLVVVVAI